jgi:peptide/nickel transport system substrate-binding protein
VRARPRRIRIFPLFLALLVLVVYLAYRSRQEAPAGAAAGSSATEPARRGGQIVASFRVEPASFNRIVAGDQSSDMLAMLLQARLVRINRASFELEPWLAERWESSADGRRHTLHLRQGALWSDGTPFTSADVLFSLEAALDPKSESVIADNLKIGGEPIRATAPDPSTVVVEFPAPSGPGLRILDNLPIVPKHRLEGALRSGTFSNAWNTSTPPSELAGMGPFVLREYLPGQRLVLDRNPRYWRTAPDGQPLPYLDRIVIEFVPEQNAELLRLQAGALDLTQGELRPDDYVPVRRAEEEGKLTRVELGVSPDPDAFWFCLNPAVKEKDPRFAFLQKREFRQAISHAVDREEFAQDVFLGEAVPVWGPITPGNRAWFSPDLQRYPHDDAKARELLRSIGLEDRNADGVVEDASGTEARFTVISQRGLGYSERGTTVLRDELRGIGIALDIAALDTAAVFSRIPGCDYDAMFVRPSFTDLDPAGNLDFWLSSGGNHFWNMSQPTPATSWEAEIDRLMLEQASTLDPDRRREIFVEVQRVFAENLPVLYFAAPRMYAAHSRRLAGVVPSVMRPPILWNADSLRVN